jgi:hypothetical protein
MRERFTDSRERPDGGRTWWAHFEFTRINITPTILHKKIEDLREVPASVSISRLHASLSTASSFVVAIPE